MSSAIFSKYEAISAESSDMIEHMPTLKNYASLCRSVVEFGVYDCTSTWGLLAGLPAKMRSYDIVRRAEVDEVEKLSSAAGIDFQFILGNTLQVVIEDADLLFIDSMHTYDHLRQELKLHAEKAKKFIILHDTTIFGDMDQHGFNGPGLWPAIQEFLADNRAWSVRERFTNCNGLTVLKRAYE
jgi:hypothetical protein